MRSKNSKEKNRAALALSLAFHQSCYGEHGSVMYFIHRICQDNNLTFTERLDIALEISELNRL